VCGARRVVGFMAFTMATNLASGVLADPVVQFDSIVAAGYSFSNSDGNKSVNSTAASATMSPRDVGLQDPNADPTVTGMLGMQAAANTLVVKAKRSVDNGSNTGVQSATADVKVSALFKVVGDPANPNALYNVSEQDLLSGVLRTTGKSASPGSLAQGIVLFTTTVSTASYTQTFSVSNDGKTFSVTRGKLGVGVVNNPTTDFQFTAGSNESTINSDAGALYLTTVHGDQLFVVTAELRVDTVVIGGASAASSNFFDTGSLTLTASIVPEPGVLVLTGFGLGWFALGRFNLGGSSGSERSS